MFKPLQEKELTFHLDSANDRTENITKEEDIKDDAVLTRALDIYVSEMHAFMKSVPHITPTHFELKFRHQKLKQCLIKQMKINNKNIGNCAVNRLLDKFENQLEEMFIILDKENAVEYKNCQLAFTIGWKCNVNQRNRSFETIDERF